MWKIGDKAQCVNNAASCLNGVKLKKDSIYCVQRVGLCPVSGDVVLDVGVESGHPNRSWRADRFRKIIPRSEHKKANRKVEVFAFANSPVRVREE